MARAVPTIGDVSYAELMADPYPSYERIRDLAPAVFVASANITLLTRFDDLVAVERDPVTYSSVMPQSLVRKLMGPTFMRMDGEGHTSRRKVIEPSLRPGTIKSHWAPRFEEICDRLIEAIEHDGRADLYTAFAAPMAAASLAELLGFCDVSWETMQDWSQALIDGAGNYSGDVDVDRRAYEASAGVDAAIDAVLEDHIASPNPSMLSSMINATSPMPIEEIRANVKVVIGGGLNEPRDAILTLALALLENPSQRDAVLANPELWPAALEEAIRWISPIGMYPRRVARDTELSGIRLPEGLQIGLCVGAANRDSRRFADPDRFDICRPKQSHLGFGAGTHFCAGAWMARHTVGRLAVPKLFARLRNLRLADDGRPAIRGWVFRGPVSLPVRWN